ncbi:MAG: hypothetical protein KAJ81_05085 [Candidatus Latescibacteria bacterium]|nr:hypothetical protein [Candidatus Latescibacterota bacterium]
MATCGRLFAFTSHLSSEEDGSEPWVKAACSVQVCAVGIDGPMRLGAGFVFVGRCQKMKELWALLFVVLLSFSVAKAEEGQDFFPFQVGNTWTYRCWLDGKPSDNILTASIIGTKLLDDRTYFMLVGHFSRAVSIREDTLLVRRSGDQVMLNFGEFDKLWLDFSAEIGQSWEVPMRFAPSDLTFKDARISLESITGFLTVVGRSFGKALTFHITPPYIDGDWTETYAAGIGPTMREGFAADGQYLICLVEAEIGGRKLDFTSSIGKDCWGRVKSLYRFGRRER